MVLSSEVFFFLYLPHIMSDSSGQDSEYPVGSWAARLANELEEDAREKSSLSHHSEDDEAQSKRRDCDPKNRDVRKRN